MTLNEYLESIQNEQPSLELSETLTSLWWDKKGDWDRAHAIAIELIFVNFDYICQICGGEKTRIHSTSCKNYEYLKPVYIPVKNLSMSF